MAQFSVRMEDSLVMALDDLAEKHHASRNEAIARLVKRAIKEDFLPLTPGQAMRATSQQGGTIALMIMTEDLITSGQTGLAQDEVEIFQEVVRLVNAGNWAAAQKMLVENGFSIEY